MDEVIYWLWRPWGDVAWDLAPFFIFVMPWIALTGFTVTAVACYFVKNKPVSLYVHFGCASLIFVCIGLLVFNLAEEMSFPLLVFAWALTGAAAIAAVTEAAVRKLGRESILLAIGSLLSSCSFYLVLVGLAAASGV